MLLGLIGLRTLGDANKFQRIFHVVPVQSCLQSVQAIGRPTPQARKKRVLRALESDEQLALKLENLGVQVAETHSHESLEQREVRLETDRVRILRPVRLNYLDNGKLIP